MEAFTYKLKTPMITGGRSHIPLADTELMSVGNQLLFGWAQEQTPLSLW